MRFPWAIIIQPSFIQCHIYPGALDGMRLVPEPIADIDLKGPPVMVLIIAFIS